MIREFRGGTGFSDGRRISGFGFGSVSELRREKDEIRFSMELRREVGFGFVGRVLLMLGRRFGGRIGDSFGLGFLVVFFFGVRRV